MAESALLKSARKLDRGALPVIFDIYAPVVYRYCFRLCLDPIRSDELGGIVFSRLLETLTHAEIPAIKLKVCIFQVVYQVMMDGSESASQTTPMKEDVCRLRDRRRPVKGCERKNEVS